MPNELTGNPNKHSPESFKDALTGSCLCGSITVTIRDPDLFTSEKGRGHLCHCANCRKVAGSYVSSNLVIEEEKVTIEDKNGTMKVYEDNNNTLSGGTVYRSFCGVDGNPICSRVPARKGKVIVKMGMFPRIPKPEMESFALHRHDWQGKHDGLEQYKIAVFQEKLGE